MSKVKEYAQFVEEVHSEFNLRTDLILENVMSVNLAENFIAGDDVSTCVDKLTNKYKITFQKIKSKPS